MISERIWSQPELPNEHFPNGWNTSQRIIQHCSLTLTGRLFGQSSDFCRNLTATVWPIAIWEWPRVSKLNRACSLWSFSFTISMSYWYDIPYSSIHVSPPKKNVFLPSYRTKRYLHFGGGVTVSSPFFRTFGTNGNFDLARRGITSAMLSSTLQLLVEITSVGWFFAGNVERSLSSENVSPWSVFENQ